MKHAHLPMPQLAGIAATRALLGAGVALLLSERMAPDSRRFWGVLCTAIGVLSTAPLAYDVLNHRVR